MWKEHQRDDSRTATQAPRISFRRGGIAFNSKLIRAARATGSTRATLFFDDRGNRVGVRFHSGAKPNAYALTADGGHGASHGRWIQVGRVYAVHPWLADVLNRPVHDRRFEAHHDAANGIWYVEVK